MDYRRKSFLWIALIVLIFSVSVYLSDGLSLHETALLISVCFLCELIDSGLGMGYGTILTPTLMMLGFSPADIVPTILFSELLSGFSASYFHNEIWNVRFTGSGTHLKPALLLAGGSTVGVTIGVILAVNLPVDMLRITIGTIIFLSGFFVVLLSRKIIQYKNWKMLVISGLASFNKAVSGGGYGPLVTSGQILSGVKGKSAVGITSFAEAFTCFVAVLLFTTQGGYINFRIFIPMVCGALISVPFSVFAINKARENHLKNIIGILTMLMGALILYKVFS